ncbi:MAG: SDR family NAD(P)-dependent oxidoreductase [Thermoleophilia bacterium]|nr:SDR family NAD(P)-dependent oxidoreductase [Thermoleophilia bacterium]
MILVTGGTGFVGPKIVHALRTEGAEVRVLARNPASRAARTAEAWGCSLAAGDMTDLASLRRAVAGCDTVVHLVAILLGPEDAFDRVMVAGTRALLEAARDAGVRRVVLMSALGTGEGTKELTPYFRAKWEQEEAVEASGIPYAIFRPSFVFAPDGGVLQAALRVVRFSPVVPVVVPDLRLQPIWAADVASFFTAAAVHGKGTNGTWELGGAEVVTWRELWDRVERILGKRRANPTLPLGLLRAAAALGNLLPPTRGAPGGVTMLSFGDNVTDIGPAVEEFGVRPIGLDEQIRRAVG